MCEVKSSFKGGRDWTEGHQSESMWLVIESVCGESWGRFIGSPQTYESEIIP